MPTVAISQALPGYLMRGSMKAEAINYLAIADLDVGTRRRLYRAWCAATATKWRTEDADRVALLAKAVARDALRRQLKNF